MASRKNWNPLNLSITLTPSAFADRSGLRGRPQKHPILTLDMSDEKVQALIPNPDSVKKVRNEVFRLVRAQLGVSEQNVIVEHARQPGAWVLKAEVGQENFLVTVGVEEPAAVAETVAEVVAEAATGAVSEAVETVSESTETTIEA